MKKGTCNRWIKTIETNRSTRGTHANREKTIHRLETVEQLLLVKEEVDKKIHEEVHLNTIATLTAILVGTLV